MTWEYSGNPANSQRDAVRFLIGDTEQSDQQLSDEEIAWLLGQFPNQYRAAAQACKALAAKYARQVDKAIGDLKVSAQQKQEHYLALANSLQEQAVISTVAPYAGGISISDKQEAEDDADRVEPMFRRDMMRSPGTAYTPEHELEKWSNA
jgi:uncharacterized protein (DUF924 family)